MALGWHVFSVYRKEIGWHNGGTAGYRTFIGFDPKARVGVVVLSNAGTPAGPDDIGRHLLDSESPLLAPQAAPKTRTEVAIDPALFDRYVGRYQLAPAAIIAVTRDGSHLFVQLTGQPKFEVFPEGPKDFFLKIVDAQITFEAAGDGKAEALVLHQNGVNQRAKRIEGEPVLPKEIAVDPKAFDAYVGRYELRPGLVMTMTRDDLHLYTQLTGQPRFEVFASGPREFFLKAVDAQLTFEVGADGRATAAILHQNGRDVRAARIE